MMQVDLGYRALFVAVAVFVLFILFSVLIRVGRHSAPLRSLCRTHFIFGFVYAACALFSNFLDLDLLQLGKVSWQDWVVGGVCYFFLQYPVLLIVFGQISRGFSLNICVSAYKKGGSLTIAQIFSEYGDHKGVEYVKTERLRVMSESSVVREEKGYLSLTAFGELAVRMNRFLLTLWGLDYLGRSETMTEAHND